ncbi:diaminopimelate decarboxylase [Pyruvatibacter sp.]|uniref:diaminopimelate decarboxylase n=1 Tax=Pyruvatibacter sp. TaxID=1981328 RepID=UPI0032667842
MHHFAYKNGALHAEDVALSAIAEEVGTPFYCYSTATLERHYRVFSEAFKQGTGGNPALVCFSVKSNSNLAVVSTLARMGAGADVVSQGEIRIARAAGVPADKIVFSGVGKKRDEMAYALDAGILMFNVESEPELEALNEVALAKNMRAPISLRVNPDVDANTHVKITTGKAENKFGIAWERAHAVYARAAELPGIEIVGVDVHIGSQITSLDPFRAAFAKVAELVRELKDQGHDVRNVDLGGGLGIPYMQGNEPPPHPDEYGRIACDAFADLDVRLLFEPGRIIAGNAGVLVTEVTYVKNGEAKDFLILDAGMNDLIRPTLYDAWHDMLPLKEADADAPRLKADIVGPVCESGDTFAKDRELPALAQGDRLAILSAGAYGAVQASTYNARPLVAEVMVNGDQWSVVRERQTYDALLADNRMPGWLDT